MIAFVIYDINVCGGTHKQFLKLLEYTERQGQDFIIITKKLDLNKTYEGFKKYENRIRVYDYYDYPSIFKHRILRRLIPIYNKWKLRDMLKGCNIVNIHDNGFEEIYPLIRHKKVYWQINDLHASFHVGASRLSSDSEQSAEMREYIRRETNKFTAITVNVGKNADRVRKYLNRESYIFYCGVEPIPIKCDRNKTYARFENKQINILTSGVFFGFRNYETQVAVVKELVERGYDVRLHIIGDTSRSPGYAKLIQQLIDSNNLSKRITIEGQVDNERFKYLHENADMFMFINIDQSWGLAVFEAMSCGLPVLVSKSVGATEILDDGENAIFVDPKDKFAILKEIERLVYDKDYYKNISERASKFHEDWTWDKAYCSKMYNLMMK